MRKGHRNTHCIQGHPMTPENIRGVARPRCRICAKQAQREWYVENPEKAHAANRRQRTEHPERYAGYDRIKRLKQYGITQQEYDAMLNKQGGVCAICKDPNINEMRLAIDHDHITGKVRGLLCIPCNSGIGLLGDTKEDLQAAINYLS